MKRRILVLMIVCAIFFQGVCCVFAANENQAGTEYDNVDLENQDKIDVKYVTDSVTTFSDLYDDELKKTVGLLYSIGIVPESEENKFYPDNNITRFEYVDYVLKCLSIDAEKHYSDDMKSFYDADKKDYKNKVLSVAATWDIISGYSDNSFRGDEYLSYNDAISIALRASGFKRYAELRGGYPFGYLDVAREIEVQHKVKDATAITKAEAAYIIEKWLDSPLLNGLDYSNRNEFTFDDRTVMNVYLDIYKDSGIVKANSHQTTVNQAAKNKFLLINDVYYGQEKNIFDSFLGHKVDYYYYNETADIVYMCDSRNVNIIRIEAEDYVDVDNMHVKYMLENKLRSERIDDYAIVFLNGVPQAIRDYREVFDINEGYIELLSNDGGSTYDYVFVNRYENIVIKSITYDGSNIVIEPDYDIKSIEIEMSEDFKLEIFDARGQRIEYNVTIDGVFDSNGNPMKTIDFSSVPQNSVVSIFSDKYESHRGHMIPAADTTYLKAIISDKKVTGEVAAIDGDGSFEINENMYLISNSHFFDELDENVGLGSKGDFYLDAYDKIVAFEKDSTLDEFSYGYIIDAGETSWLDFKVQCKIMTEIGEFKIYDFKENLIINNKKTKEKDVMNSLQQSAKYANPSFEISQLIKYKVNANGEISEIQTLLQSEGSPSGYDENQLRIDEPKARYSVSDEYTNGRPQKLDYEFTPSNLAQDKSSYFPYFAPEIVFRVPSTESSDEFNYAIGMNSKYSNQTLEMYNIGVDKTPEIALHYVAVKTSASDSLIHTNGSRQLPVMFKEVKHRRDEEGFWVTAISVVTGQAEREYLSDIDNICDGLVPGDLIYLWTNNNENKISKITHATLSNGLEISPDTILDMSDLEQWNNFTANQIDSYGEVYYVSGNKFVIQRGPIVDSALGERQIQVTGYFSNGAWMYGGAILYDDTDPNSAPVIKVAKSSDLKSIYQDGQGNATKVYYWAQAGAARMYVFYNTNN